MRHSKSSWSNPSLDDFDRPLSKRGKNNAKLICEFFVKKNYKFPTSAFAKINFDLIEWKEIKNNGLIKEFIRPKDLQDSKE